MSTKPLFVPLQTRWFRAFADGVKSVEYRAYGPRWNERTCNPGRDVVLSHGYSGARIAATVLGFRVIWIADAPIEVQEFFVGRHDALAEITLALN